MEQLIADTLSALQSAGLAAMRFGPGMQPGRPDGAVICVGLKQASAAAAGFYDYLGVVDDPGRGRCELYGRRVTCSLRLLAVSPQKLGAAGAEEAAAGAMDALLSAPLRARIGACTAGQPFFDGQLGAWCCEVTAEASVLRYAASGDEGQTLTEFELRGEWK